MEQSPSREADSHSANQEILSLLRKPKVHYRVHKSPSSLRPCLTFRNSFFFTELLAPRPAPKLEGHLLSTYAVHSQLLPQPEDVPCRDVEFHGV
jgi:hypothetical protein